MSSPWYSRLADSLTRTREGFQGQLNVVLRRGPNLDAQFWADLEDTLVAADMGATAAGEVTARLRDSAARAALPDAQAVLGHLVAELAAELEVPTADIFASGPVTLVFVGVNGTGKTTSIAKLAREAVDTGRSVLLGSADTFRAAAIEQLDVWAQRAGVPIVSRKRGADPASVAFDTMRKAEEIGADTIIIDTAGRLHTATDLMAELTKVKRIIDRESPHPVRTLLVLDATTGQNGLSQARKFQDAVGLDGVILTKLDGTAKGGIAIAVVRELGVPIVRIGFGEGIDDLKPFEAREFAQAIVGTA